ncbi:MAG: branched-chain amino acid aminotransferase [Bacteroidota bacterium]|uniref:branched-chain amino acid aminotransferase n=1 Tax=Leeuwenhoekiella palythoae TaxID=573501 RepID=UPI001CE125CB|nr:branched-chain amino acid aminotransferase [Leeuwenhoekiella palythoae]MEC7784150.1 branched-chain amino acid aminotransferase [Bacteroidota bacterium]MEC8883498.1 branched-chain amino acid aminotransferase [Bacteroidota bacterium]MEE3148570.1 branched-chain amino acid aminotransferase [Bacteroidota bacterium]MEE3225782.1 branched-chain amino acid aminotransferase [Bacteroidota bacterium]UBZ11238.1 branched-chain amino acid aminotransferase [Leeuwenhoekiella palythoae]
MTDTLKVTKIAESKINQVDFSNLAFGTVFTDHMFVCEYKNGKWQTPEILPYGPLQMDPSAKVFHYGQAVFEGMKAYKDDKGDVYMFRPEENFNRINKSGERLAMPAFEKDYFFDGLNTLLNLDKDWIKPGEGNSLYIRPFVIATENGVSASPSSEYKFVIICAPAQAYYSGEVRVLFADHYSRSADGGVGFAKAAGNYAAQFYPTELAKAKGYNQVVWTDANTHEYLEEAGTMNVFFRVNDTLLTAPTNDRILDGITRKSLIELAKSQGINVEVRPVKVAEIVEAAENGSLKEMFGAGTAAVISPISGFTHKEKAFDLPKMEYSFATKLKKQLTELQANRAEDPFGWRYEVPAIEV